MSSPYRAVRIFVAVVALSPAVSFAQKQSGNINQLVDRIAIREQREVAAIRQYRPIVETYIQDVHQDKDLGAIPVKDHYLIGIADFSNGAVAVHSMKAQKDAGKKRTPLDLVSEPFSANYVPAGFLEMIFVDPNGFNRHHYQFEYIGREFLGEVRCLVFDVSPAPHSGKGRFKGRIWVEDSDYTIVRFNGAFEPMASKFGFNLHFDSWRLNGGPGLWLPAYIYNEQLGLSNSLFGHVNERSQTRLWGYASRKASMEDEFSELKVESSNVEDRSGADQSPSPIEQQREWERKADLIAIERLERAGLIAPPGGADEALNVVVNNIEVTNNIDPQREIKCRVLVTSTLEIFSVGRTIVISRGLLDVLPNETSLAAMLAHEMAHILLGNSPASASASAFADQTIFSDEESLRKFSFHIDEGDEQATNEKALELLKNSPYKDQLMSAGLFLRQLDAGSKQLTALISPHLSDRAFLSSELVDLAPPLEPTNLNQIAALPLGSRIKLDPWTDRVELIKPRPVELASPKEKMPLGLTPFYPYLTRATDAESPAAIQTTRQVVGAR